MIDIKSFWIRHKTNNIRVFKALLFLILAYNLYSKFSGDEFQNAWATFVKEFSIYRIHFLVIAIFFTFVNWGLETLKYFITIQRVEKLSYFRAYRGILYGNALNLILPASIGELTGRPLVLKEENRAEGSGVAYYVSIVQKVASPVVGLLFFSVAVVFGFLENSTINISNYAFNAFYFIVVVSIFDFLFWFFLYLKPQVILHILEHIQRLKKIFEKIEHALDYPLSVKLKLLGIGMLRFLVFVFQYWVLTFLFFSDFPHFTFFILCGVYFLAQFVIPSLGFSDIMLRATLVSIVFSDYSENFVQLLAVNVLIWIINVLVPSLVGFYLMQREKI